MSEPMSYDLAATILAGIEGNIEIDEVRQDGPTSSVLTVFYRDGSAFEVEVRRANVSPDGRTARDEEIDAYGTIDAYLAATS